MYFSSLICDVVLCVQSLFGSLISTPSLFSFKVYSSTIYGFEPIIISSFFPSELHVGLYPNKSKVSYSSISIQEEFA